MRFLWQQRVARESRDEVSVGARRAGSDSNVIDTIAFAAQSGTPRRSKGGRRAAGAGHAAAMETRCVRSGRARTIAILPVGVCVCVLLGVSSAVKCARQSDEAPSSPVQNRRVFVFDASTEAFPGEKQRAGDGLILSRWSMMVQVCQVKKKPTGHTAERLKAQPEPRTRDRARGLEHTRAREVSACRLSRARSDTESTLGRAGGRGALAEEGRARSETHTVWAPDRNGNECFRRGRHRARSSCRVISTPRRRRSTSMGS